MTTQLVFARNGQALTTSVIIAENTNNTHQAMLKLVRGYLNDFEVFGRVGFEIQPFETNGGNQKREVAILNEQQATLLVTYCKNTETVRKFKVALVKAFYEMREQLQPKCPALTRPCITNEQRLAIMSEVNRRACSQGVPRSDLYKELKRYFGVQKFTEIKADQFELAIKHIQMLVLRRKQEALPSPRTLSDNELLAIARLHRMHCDPYWKNCLLDTYKVLKAANSSFAGRFYDIIHEPVISLMTIERILKRNDLAYSY